MQGKTINTMYIITAIIKTNGSERTLQEDGTLCSLFGNKPKKFQYKATAISSAKKILNNGLYSKVAIIDIDGGMHDVVCELP